MREVLGNPSPIPRFPKTETRLRDISRVEVNAEGINPYLLRVGSELPFESQISLLIELIVKCTFHFLAVPQVFSICWFNHNMHIPKTILFSMRRNVVCGRLCCIKGIAQNVFRCVWVSTENKDVLVCGRAKLGWEILLWNK